MRTRFTRSPLQSIRVPERCWDNKITNNYAPITAVYTGVEKLIIDEPGPVRKIQGGLAYKNVKHTQYRFKPVTGAATFATGSGSAGTIYCDFGVARSLSYAIDPYFLSQTDLGQVLGNRLIDKVPDAITGFNDRWLRSKPSMSSRANLAVSLWELGDIKRMFDVLPLRHFGRPWSGIRKELFSQGSYWNGVHLNYNFGWKPFLSDVKSVFKGMSTFQERLERFLSEAGKDLRIHAQDRSSLSGVETIKHPNATWFEAYFAYSVEYTLGSTFCLRYTLPDYDCNELTWRSLLDTLGLKVNPANIWAVLPWSFVIDWFLDIGSYLDQYSSDWIQPSLAFIQACTSVKATGHADIKIKCIGYDHPANASPRHAGSVDVNVFVRKVRFPSHCFELGTLDADKIRLLASLAAARIF